MSVYFIRAVAGDGPIKIGCSSHIDSRLKQLCCDYKTDLEVIASAPGDFLAERNVLLKFSEHNIDFTNSRGDPCNEWFSPADALLEFIEEVKRTGELPLSIEDCREEQMRERYVGGATLAEIGDEFGVTRERVRQILRATGVPSLGYRPDVTRSVVTPEIEAQIIERGRRGETQPQIAKALGIGRHNVCEYLRRNGIKTVRAKRPVSPRIRKEAAEIAADYNAGKTTYEIAEKFGRQQPEIYRLLRIVGVEPNRRAQKVASLDVDTLVSEYRRGATLVDLAERHGCGTQAIRNRLDARGCLRSKAENEAIRIARVAAANAARFAA